ERSSRSWRSACRSGCRWAPRVWWRSPSSASVTRPTCRPRWPTGWATSSCSPSRSSSSPGSCSTAPASPTGWSRCSCTSSGGSGAGSRTRPSGPTSAYPGSRAAHRPTPQPSSVMLPAMRKEGYSPTYAAAINASAPIIGPIFPPSIPMIFVALVTHLSIGKLFLGGVVPALLLAAAMILLIMSHGGRGKLPEARPEAYTQTPLLPLLGRALPALLAPLLLVVGIITGFATVTEIAILAATYVLFLGVVVYRTITFRDLFPLFRSSAVNSATIMILFAVVGTCSHVLTVGGLSEHVTELVGALDVGPVAFLLLAMLFFLIVGMPMDAVPATLIFLPTLLPVAGALGIDPIHCGVIVVVNLMMGLLTWPVGALLYVITKTSGVPFGRLSVAVLPFFGAMLAVLLLLALVPGLVTWLPNLLLG